MFLVTKTIRKPGGSSSDRFEDVVRFVKTSEEARELYRTWTGDYEVSGVTIGVIMESTMYPSYFTEAQLNAIIDTVNVNAALSDGKVEKEIWEDSTAGIMKIRFGLDRNDWIDNIQEEDYAENPIEFVERFASRLGLIEMEASNYTLYKTIIGKKRKGNAS